MTQIQKWGNSLAVRIPKALAEQLGLEASTAVELLAEEGQLIVRPAQKPYSLAELLTGITPENLPPETDWGQPEGREEW